MDNRRRSADNCRSDFKVRSSNTYPCVYEVRRLIELTSHFSDVAKLDLRYRYTTFGYVVVATLVSQMYSLRQQ